MREAASPLDAAPIATLIVREGIITYANEAALALLGASRLVGRPHLDVLAPEDVALVADRYARRTRGEAAPEVYEATFVGGRGQRTVEVHVTTRGADTIAQLIDITGEATRRKRLASLAQLGAAVQKERRDDAVQRAMHEALRALELESVLLRPRGGELVVDGARFEPTRQAFLEAAIGRAMAGMPRAWSPFTQQVWTEGAAFTGDWLQEERHFHPAARPAPALGAPAAAGVRIDVDGEPTALLLAVGDWLRPEDLPAFRLFGAQVSSALDAARSIEQLSARNARLDALNRVAEGAATAANLASFLDRATEDVVEAVAADAAVVLRVDCDRGAAEVLHVHGRDEAARTFMRGTPAHDAPIWAVALDGTPCVRQARDLHAAGSDTVWLGFATVAAVPLRYRSSVVGVLSVGFRERREDAACGLDLLHAMGAHFAAAIETHRLLGDLRRRVAELTLLNDIAVATATLDPVLLVENALRRVTATLRADTAAAYVAEGGELVQVAALGVSPETAARTARLPPGTGVIGAAFSQRRTLHFPDVDGVGEPLATAVREEGLRCVVGVPLVAKDRALGALAFGRRRPEPFSDAELGLLSAIGVQLGVAVENARLFADTRRRVGDLEAVNSLALRVFGSAPGDAATLLAETCKEIARALSAKSAVVLQLDDSGECLRGVAGWGTPLPPAELTVPLARSDLAARALRTQEPVCGLHLLEGARPGEDGPPPLSLLLVPLTSRGATRGLVAVADAPQRRFGDAEIALAYALASEAAMGLENAELYSDARRRAEELGLLLELGRALVATLELDEVLDAGVRNLARIVDAPIAALCLPDPSTGQLVIRAQSGSDADLVGTPPAEGALVAAAYARHRPVAAEDMLAERRGDARLIAKTGARAALAVPLVVRDRAIGSAIILETRGPRRFTPAEVERAAAVANQLAVALEHARLYEDLRRSYAELAHAQGRIVRQERLAALGELAAIVAHEVRNPLGVIFNSLGSLRRILKPTGDVKMLLGIVGEEADRLNRIVGDLLDFAKPSPPALHPERLARVIDEALSAAVPGNGHVTLALDVPDDLPAVPMDGRLVRQALLNLTLNAVQAMPQGGTLSVVARVDRGAVRVEIGDTGPGIPEEVRHRIFEPFFTTKATGTGLGLAVVKRIVDDHQGALEVRSAPGEGTTFVVRLPLDRAPPVVTHPALE